MQTNKMALCPRRHNPNNLTACYETACMHIMCIRRATRRFRLTPISVKSRIVYTLLYTTSPALLEPGCVLSERSGRFRVSPLLLPSLLPPSVRVSFVRTLGEPWDGDYFKFYLNIFFVFLLHMIYNNDIFTVL